MRSAASPRSSPTAIGRGQISAADHSSMSFNCQGELLAILTPLVGHVLDGVYVSKEIEFDAPAPFNDAEAIKVINGIVKTGDIPKGTKPNQFTSAADNYGYALGIMKKDGTKQLNTKGNEFVEDLDEWIETQTSQGNQQISVETVCKNFTGTGRAERQELRPVSPDDRHLPALPRAGRQAPHPDVRQRGGDRRHRLHQHRRPDLQRRLAELDGEGAAAQGPRRLAGAGSVSPPSCSTTNRSRRSRRTATSPPPSTG